MIKFQVYVNVDKYMKNYSKYLKNLGVDFTGENKKIKYIDPSAYFDGTDYSMIHLGDDVTISREVMILTHDYSITSAVASLGIYIDRNEGEYFFVKDVRIGSHTFVGARASLLPGTNVGECCIVGACSVVKGNIPDYSIVIGNPARVIGSTKDYAQKHMEMRDFLIE